MNKITLDDWKKSVESFHDSFEEFKLLAKNTKNGLMRDTTNSIEVLFRKFGYFDFYGDEVEDFSKKITGQIKGEEFENYLSFMEHFDYFESSINKKFRDLFDEGKYEIVCARMGDLLRILGREWRIKYYTFPSISDGFDEMSHVVYRLIGSYLWIKPYIKVQAIEEIMSILLEGGFPCGYKIIDENENILESEYTFLVFKPFP